jgi:hypothetical protein
MLQSIRKEAAMDAPREELPTSVEELAAAPETGEFHVEPALDEQTVQDLRRLLRLLVGGGDLSLEALLRNLEKWESKLADEELLSPETAARSGARGQQQRVELLRYALTGLLFEAQDGLMEGLGLLDRLGRAVDRLAQPWLRPVQRSRLLSPFWKRYEALAQRGEQEVNRWIERGRREARLSRRLAETALKTTVDQNIEYLTTNPEVQELVQTQSTGLANEVIEEVRERTVSADTFLEGLARSLLRRVPRQYLPEPSGEVRQRATGFRPPKKRKKVVPR